MGEQSSFIGFYLGRIRKGNEDRGFLTVSVLDVKKSTEHIN